jgi:hypothetical protein
MEEGQAAAKVERHSLAFYTGISTFVLKTSQKRHLPGLTSKPKSLLKIVSCASGNSFVTNLCSFGKLGAAIAPGVLIRLNFEGSTLMQPAGSRHSRLFKSACADCLNGGWLAGTPRVVPGSFCGEL